MGDPQLRAGIVYLAIAAGGIYLLVTGRAARLVGYLTGGVTGTPVTTTQGPLQGPSFLRGSATASRPAAGGSPAFPGG